ncbi:MAG TPA: GNAT family N-acetyltransferase, partial [Acidimicrobiales bacterium]|nr:GNAT family N-acetyltransferase [Acidimicrobiales bacterium]
MPADLALNLPSPVSPGVPPFSLAGRFVRLLPLEAEHVEPLLAAATDDRSTFGLASVPWDRSSMEAYVGRALERRAAGDQYPFATWSVEQSRIVGSTRFYDMVVWDWGAVAPGLEHRGRGGGVDATNIGYTWLHPSAQRTAVNTEAKLLMLAHAFES